MYKSPVGTLGVSTGRASHEYRWDGEWFNISGGHRSHRRLDPGEGHDEDLSQPGRAPPSITNARVDKFRSDQRCHTAANLSTPMFDSELSYPQYGSTDGGANG